MSGQNIALKLMWNDRGWAAKCSDDLCSLHRRAENSYCAQMTGTDDDCRAGRPRVGCWERQLAQRWRFGSSRGRFSQLAEHGIAVLTAKHPAWEERDRRIVGFMEIHRVEGTTAGDIIRGNADYSLLFDPTVIDLRFWRYRRISDVAWGSGLFRYLTREETIPMLEDAHEDLRELDLREARDKVKALLDGQRGLFGYRL